MQVNINRKWKGLEKGGKDKKLPCTRKISLHYLTGIDNFFSTTHP